MVGKRAENSVRHLASPLLEHQAVNRSGTPRDSCMHGSGDTLEVMNIKKQCPNVSIGWTGMDQCKNPSACPRLLKVKALELPGRAEGIARSPPGACYFAKQLNVQDRRGRLGLVVNDACEGQARSSNSKVILANHIMVRMHQNIGDFRQE